MILAPVPDIFGTVSPSYVFEGLLLSGVGPVSAVIHSPHKKSHSTTICVGSLTIDFLPRTGTAALLTLWIHIRQELKDLAVWNCTKDSKGMLYCINNSHVVLGHSDV